MATGSGIPMARFDACLLQGARVRAPSGHRVVAADSSRGTPTDRPTGWVFLPRKDDWRARRLIDSDIVALLEACRRPVRARTTGIATRQLARLLLDGLLEVEVAGRFRSGAGAHRVLFPDPTPPAPRGPLGRVSLEALRAAAAGGPDSPARLADRLYRFNTRPASAAWQRRIPDDHAATRYLGLQDPGTGGGDSGPWRVWHASRRPGPATGAPTWKLYVSPEPGSTATAWRALRATLGEPHGPFSMKVGRTFTGVLRPDRLVAYFADSSSLRSTATGLRHALRGMVAQGVPFTASLGGNGLLSWGADFGGVDSLPELALERSWRGWVTVRLGSALATALRSGARHPVTFAFDRMSLDGVNVRTWSPGARHLHREATVDADH